MKVYCAFNGTVLMRISMSPLGVGVNDNLTYFDYEIGSIENRYPEELISYLRGMSIDLRLQLLGHLQKSDYALYLVVLLEIPGLLDNTLNKIFLHPLETRNELVGYVEAIEKENNHVNS